MAPGHIAGLAGSWKNPWMIDEEGYRPNVGIILTNTDGHVLWAHRCRNSGWQFPQGGIKAHETPDQALFRELEEEVGLRSNHVRILGRTQDWLRYDIPPEFQRMQRKTVFRGQKQIWYLLRLLGSDHDVRLDACQHPEFDRWRWVHYWLPLDEIVAFKRDVYERALRELEPLLSGQDLASQGMSE